MFRHVVLFSWKKEATETQITNLERVIAGLPAMVPEIRRYEYGRDAGLADGNFDFAIVADFESRADWQVYWDHPQHQAIIRDHFRPVTSQRVAVQYRFGE